MDTSRNEDASEYLRVSHDASGRLRSAEEQHDDNKRTAAAEGWTLGDPYVEDGAVSASRYGRKVRAGFAALVADLEAGRFGARILMLWEPSRGSRRLSEWARFIELLEKRSVLLYVTSHGRTYDPANARDRRSLHEDGTDSEYESAKISGRVRRAMAANAAAGKPHGRILYGYRREYEVTPAGRRIMLGQVHEAPEAAIVREIFASIGKGHSLRAIAEELNKIGVSTGTDGAKWTPQRIRDLAVNPAYAGRRVHKGEEVAGNWPAIVAPELYFAVRDLLTDPARRTSRPGREKHLLSMIARCDVCDGILGVRYRPQARYWCRDAGHVMIPEADLDDYVTRLVLARLARDDAYGELGDGADPGALAAARDELARARAHHGELTAAMAAAQISVTAFAAAEPAVLGAVAAAERTVSELAAPSALRLLLGDPSADVAARWRDAGLTARREVIRTLFARIAVGRLVPGQEIHERAVTEWRGSR